MRNKNIWVRTSDDTFFASVINGTYRMPDDIAILESDYNKLKSYILDNRTYYSKKKNGTQVILSLMKKIDDKIKYKRF